jgi:hypothetical protein
VCDIADGGEQGRMHHGGSGAKQHRRDRPDGEGVRDSEYRERAAS